MEIARHVIFEPSDCHAHLSQPKLQKLKDNDMLTIKAFRSSSRYWRKTLDELLDNEIARWDKVSGSSDIVVWFQHECFLADAKAVRSPPSKWKQHDLLSK